MFGYCGGVEGKVKFGDFCFFVSIVFWDYGKWTEIRNGDGELILEWFLFCLTVLMVLD